LFYGDSISFLTSVAIIPVWKNKEIFEVLQLFDKEYTNQIIIVLDEPNEYYISKITKIGEQIPPQLKIITNPERRGIGYAISLGLEYACSNGFETAIIMAGNGKDNPQEIPKFLEKVSDGYDYVQGSRFLKGGRYDGLPLRRKIFNRIWPLFWSIITFRKQTEVTNGFRAYKLRILSDPNIDIYQDWLRGYALEYYIHYKMMTLRYYNFTEIPVSKIYHKKNDYTKIQPKKHWKQIIMPPFLLLFKIKK